MVQKKRGSLPIKLLKVGLKLLLAAAALPTFAQDAGRPAGWTAESHGNCAAPNYELILPDDVVKEIYITFTPAAWQAEEADMLELYGERGSNEGGRGRPGGPGGFGRMPQPNIAELAETLERSESAVSAALALLPDFAAAAARLEMEEAAIFEALGFPSGFALPPGGFGPGGGRGNPNQTGRGLQLAERNPIWVPVTIQFGDQTWWQVGFRFKGNSTLTSGWRNGVDNLPFKLDFDEFEDEHPELDNQRFYGFKQLSFAGGDFDPSLQREKVAADIFRQAGVPAAQTAFYAVYVDTGAGAGFQYWGLYTAIELPDDTLIETQFSDDSGNMYKPEGSGATFAADSFREESFDKETNRDSNYADVLALFAALHAENRLSAPADWRNSLETVFDVDGFLRWLATNTLIQNWDTYGNMPHNYYLYADPAAGQLVWIPWDNNMALQSGLGSGPAGFEPPAGRMAGSEPAADAPDAELPVGVARPGLRAALTLPLVEVAAASWPLIAFLLEDAVYAQRYVELVAQISADVFTPERMQPIYEANFELLAAYMSNTADNEAVAVLRAATDSLIEHVEARAAAAQTFLEQ